MRSFIASIVLLALAASSLSAPVASIQPKKFASCPITVLPSFPAGQTTLAVASGLTTKFLGLGVGVQNYTCSAAGTYTSVGAVATLYDISCLAASPCVTKLPSLVANSTQRASGLATVKKELGAAPVELGVHYFTTTTAGVLAPEFDLSPSQGSGQSVIESKTATLASPDGTQNVAWLELTRASGSTSFGSQVFRINTALGQPPATCTGTGSISVDYAALYYFTS